MKNFKLMKKVDLIEYLGNSEKMLKANKEDELLKTVMENIAEFTASPKKIGKDELVSLCDEVASVEAKIAKDVDKAVQQIFAEESLPLEASPKKPTLGKKKEEPKEVKKDEPKVEPKIKKEEPKQEKKEEKSKKKDTKKLDLATKFPNELTTEDDKFVLDMSITSLDQLREEIEKGAEFMFAVYWSPRLIKQFNYDEFGLADQKITRFENDLDLCQPVYVSENGKVAYVLSLYSNVMYMIKQEDLEIIDNMRYNNGAEYNIYRVK